MKKKKIIGIILLVIGVMAVFGGIVNGSLASIGEENPITAATELALIAACLIGGVILIVSAKKKQ